ncbi:MAG: YfcE family phosphodiesterase [Candidatus Thorarchaeota archaeon]|nr:MAG: YfcE family phosphodiesterase [Candidatus Thorarchaeota archaeon]
MKRVLVFGDAHIPSRRDSIPEEFYEHIERTDYDLALVTGDLVREQAMRDAMPTLPKSHFVIGNMDYGSSYNHHELVQIEEYKFLLFHGTQLRPRGNAKQLWEMLTDSGVDIAVHGHTHKPAIELHRNKLLLNPGTVSGATGGWAGKTDASFIELEVSGSELLVTLHYTDWHVVKKSEARFQKRDDKITRI